MILDYKPGDLVFWTNFGLGGQLARVTLAHHQDDGHGVSPYTRLEIITQGGRRLSLFEPEIRMCLRRPNELEAAAIAEMPPTPLIPLDAWEDVDGHTRRLYVHNRGWLYQEGGAMCFVPERC